MDKKIKKPVPQARCGEIKHQEKDPSDLNSFTESQCKQKTRTIYNTGYFKDKILLFCIFPITLLFLLFSITVVPHPHITLPCPTHLPKLKNIYIEKQIFNDPNLLS